MTSTSKHALTDELRRTFAAVADVLVPAYKQMPKASSVDISGTLLDRAVDARPDLIEPLVRGLKACLGKDAREAAEALFRGDAEAFDAVSTMASGGYYLDPKVRELIGYPGQEAIENTDPYGTPDYVSNGALQRVFDRGPIYVPTPGVVAKSHPSLHRSGRSE